MTINAFQQPIRTDVDLGYHIIMITVVGCIVSKMGFAQMLMIANFVNSMAMAMAMAMVIIMPLIQIMDVQLNALRTQQH